MKTLPAQLSLSLKLLISAALLMFFLTRIDRQVFLHALASADFSYVVMVMVIYLVAQFISTIRWTVLARPLGFETPFKDMLVYFFIGMFFNLFGPSTVGGDISRVYYLARDGKEHGRNMRSAMLEATVSVLSDRTIGMVVLIWIGAAALVLFPWFAVPHSVRVVTFALAIGLFGAGLLLPLVRRLLRKAQSSRLARLRVALQTYRDHWTALAQATALSVVAHAVQAGMHVFIGRALHIQLPLSYCFIIYPLVGTFAALPITFNGIGLREGGYLFLLAVIGVEPEKAVAFGILLFVIVAVDSLIGGIAFVTTKTPKAVPIPTESES